MENIETALEHFRPWGVDISSDVENGKVKAMAEKAGGFSVKSLSCII